MAKNLFDEFNIEYERRPQESQGSSKNLFDEFGIEYERPPEMQNNQMLGNQMPEQQQYPDKFTKYIAENYPTLNKFLDLGAAFGGGAAQGIYNTGASVANLLPGVNISHMDARQKFGPNLSDSIAFTGGDIAGNLASFLAGGGALGAAGKALGLARPAGLAGIAADIGKGAAAGYATGENQEGGGRGLAALLGGAFGGIEGAINSKKIANRIMADKAGIKKESNKLYNEVFDTAKKQGIEYAGKAPKVDINSIKKGSEGKFIKSLNEMVKSPTLENMHKAQSDMGKFMRNVKRTVKDGTAPSSTINAYAKAGEAQKNILDSMYKTFNKSPDGNVLEKLYKGATENYLTKVVPYNRSKPISKYMEKEITEKELLKRLNKNQLFKTNIGKVDPTTGLLKEHAGTALAEKYPEVALGNLLKKGSKKAAKLGTGVGAVTAAGIVGVPTLKELLGID